MRDAPIRENRIGWWVVAALGAIALGMLPAVCLYLLATGAGILASGGTLLSLEWYPREDLFGLLSLIAGTIATSVAGLALAVPAGLGAAICFRFYAPARVARAGEAALGVLSGIPSVVFGLFGTVWLVPRLGASLGTAAIVLALMVLPTFSMLALAALRQIPRGVLESGTALGLRREQAILRLGLVVTRPRLVAAAGVSLTRALGEALAVEMVCGNVAALPDSLRSPVRTLTTTLVQEFEYATGPHREALHFVALLVVIVAALAATAAVRVAARGSAS